MTGDYEILEIKMSRNVVSKITNLDTLYFNIVLSESEMGDCNALGVDESFFFTLLTVLSVCSSINPVVTKLGFEMYFLPLIY